MKTTFALATLALVALPSFALAGGCNYGNQKQAMSCAEGSVYDSETQTCVPSTTS